MTDHDLALVLPTDTEVELLGEDVETARGGIQAGDFSRFLRCRRSSLLANQFPAPVVVLGPFGESTTFTPK